MQLFAPLTLFLVLAACASPAPEFLGAEPVPIHYAGRDFVLFRTANRAEIIRMGRATRQERDYLEPLMRRLMEETTGCRIIPGTAHGDSGEIRASLRCPDTDGARSTGHSPGDSGPRGQGRHSRETTG